MGACLLQEPTASPVLCCRQQCSVVGWHTADDSACVVADAALQGKRKAREPTGSRCVAGVGCCGQLAVLWPCMRAGLLLAEPGVCRIWAWHSLSGAAVMLGSLLHPCRPPKALVDVRAKLELLLSLLAQVRMGQR